MVLFVEKPMDIIDDSIVEQFSISILNLMFMRMTIANNIKVSLQKTLHTSNVDLDLLTSQLIALWWLNSQ